MADDTIDMKSPASSVQDTFDDALAPRSSVSGTRTLIVLATPPPRPAEHWIDTDIYNDLRRLALHQMRRLPPGSTLQPTALAHEAYIRLARDDKAWRSRTHFLHTAARAMRHLLLDYRQRKWALKRGGKALKRVDISLGLMEAPRPISWTQGMHLTRAIELMQREYPQHAEILLSYLMGERIKDIARKTGIPLRTVERRLKFARAWLADYMDTTASEP